MCYISRSNSKLFMCAAPSFLHCILFCHALYHCSFDSYTRLYSNDFLWMLNWNAWHGHIWCQFTIHFVWWESAFEQINQISKIVGKKEIAETFQHGYVMCNWVQYNRAFNSIRGNRLANLFISLRSAAAEIIYYIFLCTSIACRTQIIVHWNSFWFFLFHSFVRAYLFD